MSIDRRASQRGAQATADVIRIALSAACFASIAIFTTLATQRGTPLTMIIFGRYAVATVALFPALRWYRAEKPLDRDIWRALVIGGVGQAIVATLSLSALAYIPVATLVFLFYTYPAWVTLLAAARGWEPLDRRRLASLGLSLIGVGTLVGLPGGERLHPLGVLLALSAAVAYAVYIPVMGRVQKALDPAFTALLIAIGVTGIFAIIAPLRGEFSLRQPLGSWGAIFALGTLCTAIAFRLFLRGLAGIGPVRTAIVSTIEPLFASCFAALALGQPVTSSLAVGGVFILGAVLVLQRGARSPNETAAGQTA